MTDAPQTPDQTPRKLKDLTVGDLSSKQRGFLLGGIVLAAVFNVACGLYIASVLHSNEQREAFQKEEKEFKAFQGKLIEEERAYSKVFDFLKNHSYSTNFDFAAVTLDGRNGAILSETIEHLDAVAARNGFNHCYAGKKEFPRESFGPSAVANKQDKFIAVDFFDAGRDQRTVDIYTGLFNLPSTITNAEPIKTLTYATRCPESAPR